jgi:hypothetical protein
MNGTKRPAISVFDVDFCWWIEFFCGADMGNPQRVLIWGDVLI